MELDISDSRMATATGGVFGRDIPHKIVVITPESHDVSREPRGRFGRWTTGGGRAAMTGAGSDLVDDGYDDDSVELSVGHDVSDEPRDEIGRWTDSAGGVTGKKSPAKSAKSRVRPDGKIVKRVRAGHYQVDVNGKKFIVDKISKDDDDRGHSHWNVSEQTGDTPYHYGPAFESAETLEEAISYCRASDTSAEVSDASAEVSDASDEALPEIPPHVLELFKQWRAIEAAMDARKANEKSEGVSERKLSRPVAFMGELPAPPSGISDYLEKHGQEWEPQALPQDVEQGLPQECFRNASLLVMGRRDLSYCEGVAYAAGLPDDLGFLHAWAVTNDGKVIDPTWENPEQCKYFGVKYDRATYLKRLYKKKVFGVLGGDTKSARAAILKGGI